MVKDIRRPQVGKWFFECAITRNPNNYIGWYFFRFCFYKLLRAPNDGSTIKSTPHKGFIITFLFWLPIWW